MKRLLELAIHYAPTAQVALSVLCALNYGLLHRWNKMTYWIAGSILTATVTYWTD